MEPIDDILIPQTRPAYDARRLRTRHVLRTFAALVVIAIIGYIICCYYVDGVSTPGRRMADVVGAIPGLLFGVILWWYAGRNVGELNQPLFRNPADARTDLRLDSRSGFWVAASLLAGFFGLCSVTLGALLALRGNEIVSAFPELSRHAVMAPTAKSTSTLVFNNLRISPINLLAIGAGLIVLAAVAVVLARKQSAAKN